MSVGWYRCAGSVVGWLLYCSKPILIRFMGIPGSSGDGCGRADVLGDTDELEMLLGLLCSMPSCLDSTRTPGDVAGDVFWPPRGLEDYVRDDIHCGRSASLLSTTYAFLNLHTLPNFSHCMHRGKSGSHLIFFSRQVRHAYNQSG